MERKPLSKAQRRKLRELAGVAYGRELGAAIEVLDSDDRDGLAEDAERELDPFRGRMLPESWSKAKTMACERLVRERFQLPPLRYE